MSTSLDDVLKGFSDDDRKKIDEGARLLIEDERTLRDLRRASDLADEELADLAGVPVDAIEQAERILELKVASIGRFLEAMGGDVQLVARFPDRSPVAFALSDVFVREVPSSSEATPEKSSERLRLAS